MDLIEMRTEIDRINTEMLTLFIKRMELSKAIAEFKAANGLPILNAEREQKILDEMTALVGDDLKDYVRELFKFLMDQSKDYQSNTLKSK